MKENNKDVIKQSELIRIEEDTGRNKVILDAIDIHFTKKEKSAPNIDDKLESNSFIKNEDLSETFLNQNKDCNDKLINENNKQMIDEEKYKVNKNILLNQEINVKNINVKNISNNNDYSSNKLNNINNLLINNSTDTFNAQFMNDKTNELINNLNNDSTEEEIKQIRMINYNSLVGLVNLGNTCFMNTAIQLIMNIPELVDYYLNDRFMHNIYYRNILGYKGEMGILFSHLVKEMRNTKDKFIRIADFKSGFTRITSKYADFEEEDAYEFMMTLLDCLHEDDQNTLKEERESIVSRLFNGTLTSKLQCLECSQIKEVKENFNSLSLSLLPINHKRVLFFKMGSFIPIELIVEYHWTIDNLIFVIQREYEVNDLIFVSVENGKIEKVYNSGNILSVNNDLYIYEYINSDSNNIINCNIDNNNNLINNNNDTINIDNNNMINNNDILNNNIINNNINNNIDNNIKLINNINIINNNDTINNDNNSLINDNNDNIINDNDIINNDNNNTFIYKHIKGTDEVINKLSGKYAWLRIAYNKYFFVKSYHKYLYLVLVTDSFSLHKLIDELMKTITDDYSDEDELIVDLSKSNKIFNIVTIISRKNFSHKNNLFTYNLTHKNTNDLNLLISLFTKRDYLLESNQCICEECNALTNHSKELCISQLPKYLIIHLKRVNFIEKNGSIIGTEKNNSLIQIDDILTINNINYRLNSIGCHYELDRESGHYLAYVKNDKWYLINDSKVEIVDSIDKNSTYVAVYSKIN